MTSSSNPEPITAPTGGGFCESCGAALNASARFCHRCGTPVGEVAPPPRAAAVAAAPAGNSTASILPWGITFVALLALVANFAGKSFGGGKSSAPSDLAAAPAATDAGAPPFASAGPADGPSGGAPTGSGAPNIANMSPSERAVRLYNRIMEYSEAGKTDSVNFFAPMALASHGMLTAPSQDERYHFGRIAEITGQPQIAKAQADTMLANEQGNLLGLVLAARTARIMKDVGAEKTYNMLLLKVVDREIATKNADYDLHRAEIDRAVAEAKAAK